MLDSPALRWVKPFSLIPAPPNAILWMPGQDDAYSATIRDRSGKGNNGAITGATWVQNSKGVWVESFDGGAAADDYVKVTKHASFANLAALTVMAWIKPTTTGEATAGGIFRVWVSGAGGWYFIVSLDNKLQFFVDYATIDLYRNAANSSITLGVWQLVAVTWTGSATATNIKFYIGNSSGLAETSYGTTQDGTGGRIDDSALDLYIGNNSTQTATFDGLIGLGGLCNAALSLAQLQQWFAQTRGFFGV